MSGIDVAIDALYRGRIGEFVAAGKLFCEGIAGGDGARVKRLPKPTALAWAINQLYWKQRAVYDRLRRSGEKLRDAQIAVLNGRRADVRQATEAHREAVTDAAHTAARLAQEAGGKVSTDALVRTLGALSLAQETAEEPGRLAHALQPSGFEALAGISVRAQPAEPPRTAKAPESSKPPPTGEPRRSKRETEATRRREQAEIAVAKRADAAVKQIRARLTAAERAETAARAAWQRAKEKLDRAKADLDLASRDLNASSSTPR